MIVAVGYISPVQSGWLLVTAPPAPRGVRVGPCCPAACPAASFGRSLCPDLCLFFLSRRCLCLPRLVA